MDNFVKLIQHLVHLSSLEYCYDGEWRWICFRGSQGDTDMSVAACTELGYSDSGKITIVMGIN